jgi:hypothetical protein
MEGKGFCRTPLLSPNFCLTARVGYDLIPRACTCTDTTCIIDHPLRMADSLQSRRDLLDAHSNKALGLVRLRRGKFEDAEPTFPASEGVDSTAPLTEERPAGEN